MNRLCDTHVHVFDPGRFPYAPLRKFTPDTANVAQLELHLKQIGADSVVLVQPSVYGADHSCLVDALHSLGSTAKGVAVIAPTTTRNEIDLLHRAGVVGARLNMVVNQQTNVQHARNSIQHLKLCMPNNWHIQLHVHLDVLQSLTDAIVNSKCCFVLDHLGLPDVTSGIEDKRWQHLLNVMQTGQMYVKISAPYLTSKQLDTYDDLRPFIQSLVQIRPDRVLWGSNWPHTKGTHRDPSVPFTQTESFRDEDDERWKMSCQAWTTRAWHKASSLNADHVYFGLPHTG